MMGGEIVAAVCYKRWDGEIQFLLVRTKGGKYWTFPKGHIKQKPREEPWQAAAREAREEAGVMGTIETNPFTHYAYRSGGEEAESRVAAFLLAVESQGRPREPWRHPAWFTFHQARDKFAEGGRESQYVREHERVLQEALARV